MTNAQSAQANTRSIVTVQDDQLSNATSNYFDSQTKKKLV